MWSCVTPVVPPLAGFLSLTSPVYPCPHPQPLTSAPTNESQPTGPLLHDGVNASGTSSPLGSQHTTSTSHQYTHVSHSLGPPSHPLPLLYPTTRIRLPAHLPDSTHTCSAHTFLYSHVMPCAPTLVDPQLPMWLGSVVTYCTHSRRTSSNPNLLN